jgi:hypothetical protein
VTLSKNQCSVCARPGRGRQGVATGSQATHLAIALAIAAVPIRSAHAGGEAGALVRNDGKSREITERTTELGSRGVVTHLPVEGLRGRGLIVTGVTRRLQLSSRSPGSSSVLFGNIDVLPVWPLARDLLIVCTVRETITRTWGLKCGLDPGA